METKIELIGCGTVGQGFLKILDNKKEFLFKKYAFIPKIIAVSDVNKGNLIDENGINISNLLNILEKGGNLSDLNKESEKYNNLGALDIIKKTDADITVEVSYTDIKTGEPATSYIKAALMMGKNVVTSNKGPIALYYKKLKELADSKNVCLKFEGTVMSGTPIFNLIESTLLGDTIKSIKGILNGTTNFILTKMETDGLTYDEALRLAQKLGYAEADPTADVEAYDALAKVLILSNVVFGGNLKLKDVYREGITEITREEVLKGLKEGYRYKLIGQTRIEDGKIFAEVKPVKLSVKEPLSNVSNAMNALTFETELLGEIMIQGPGAGKIETGFSILVDVLDILKRRNKILQ